MVDDKAAAMAEISQAIAGDILSLPELRDPEWDTYSMVAEVSDDFVAITAYRYTGSGAPVATAEPENDDLFWELRDRTRGTDGEAWDVVLVKIQRDTASLVMNFVSGAAADLWRVNPQNMAHLPESLRPRPQDFEGSGRLDDAPRSAPGLGARREPRRPRDELSQVSTSTSLVVEVLADGGIRLTNLAGATGLASLQATRDWIAEANRAGVPVHLRGTVTAPPAVPVVDEVRRLASSLDEEPSDPAPWPKRYSSIQTAAYNGLVEQATDLLDRGISPNVGRGATSPYRLAMQHGHTDVVVALRDAGARVPRGLAAPAALPDAVVLRAYAPRWIWWLLVPFVAVAAVAVADGVYVLALGFVLLPLLGIGAVDLMLGNTRCAFDGPAVARRRGRRWQGPIDLRTLDALGFTPPGTVRMPVLWVLGQREAGDKPDVYAKSAFDKEQRAAIAAFDGLRFVPLYAARGFLSPGFERLLARHVDRAEVIVGAIAEQRVWPG